MTICIAAGAEAHTDEPKLILCADWLVSGHLGKAESALKIKSLPHGWYLLTAGDDDEINIMEPQFRRAFAVAATIDETNAVPLARGVLLARKREKANEITQGLFGLDYDNFIDIGRDKFPLEIFRDAMLSIREAVFRAEFILAGFAGRFPMMVETQRDGRVCVREDFAAVGAGAYLAHAAMLQRAHSDVKEFHQALYNVFEAKKYAEREISVGQYTSIMISQRDGSVKTITQAGKKWLAEQYAQCGPQKLPTKWEPPDDLTMDG
jgi:hypothetical protein